MVKHGMTPIAALKAATSVDAELLGLAKSIGTLEARQARRPRGRARRPDRRHRRDRARRVRDEGGGGGRVEAALKTHQAAWSVPLDFAFSQTIVEITEHSGSIELLRCSPDGTHLASRVAGRRPSRRLALGRAESLIVQACPGPCRHAVQNPRSW